MNRQERMKNVALMVGAAGLSLLLYTFFHELGHTIVALMAGSTITEFTVLGAHMAYEGGAFTDSSDLWLHANGAFFPYVLSILLLVFYREEKKNRLYRVFAYFFSLIPLCSLLAWVILPFLYLSGSAPSGDDVTKFLYNFTFTHHPLWVSMGASLLIAFGVFLLWKKRVFSNFVQTIKELRA